MGHVSHVSHIGCELHNHGNGCDFLHPGRDHRRVLRHLSDGSTHAPFRHSVRASKIEFHQIGAGILRATHDVMPGLASGFDHERGYDRIPREPFFYFRDFTKVCFNWTIADQFDVVEPDHALVLVIDGPIAGRCVNDGLADRLPHGSSPTGVEGFHHLIGAVGRRARSQPERIRRVYATEVDAEIRHARLLSAANAGLREFLGQPAFHVRQHPRPRHRVPERRRRVRDSMSAWSRSSQ